ncbi:MAG: hypothetical protein JWN75_326 [Candidatus Saccharibacteria bacterium]|nr:hypothetical protein [Candidatus Saccharibacteria bacterium]
MDQPKTPNKAIIGIIVIVLLVAAATAVVAMSGNNANKQTSDTTASTSTSPSASTSSGASTPASSTSSFKDGSYNATGNYQSPGGPQSIDVKVVLAGGIISDASVTQHASGGEAEQYQSKFVSGYKSQVVGKKISDVNLSRVAGSSLTPIGFNDAIADIEKQAAA